MGVADTPTLLSIARWGRILGIDPLHLEGVFVQGLNTAVTCAVPIFQHPWQAAGAVSRSEVAEAIGAAERLVAEAVHYWPIPTWIADERHGTTRPARRELFRTNFLTPRGQGISTRLRYKYWRAGGQRTATVLAAASTITYTDDDGDGYDETATVTVATTVTNDFEIRIFYPGHAGDPAWEVRPRTVSLAAGTATITFRRELAVIEDLLERISLDSPDPDVHAGISGTVDTNFLTTVDIYRIWNDPQSQLNLEWEPLPTDCDCGTGCTACQVGFQAGCMVPRGDLRDGLVAMRAASWDSDDEEFDGVDLAVCRDPDHIRAWYYSGWTWEQAPESRFTQMDPFFERIITHLAASMLSRDLCGCTNVQGLVNHWREDLALGNTRGAYQLGVRRLESPWGTTRGALWAWAQLQQRGVGVGEAVLT